MNKIQYKRFFSILRKYLKDEHLLCILMQMFNVGMLNIEVGSYF